jgi:hypothetical protein
MSRQQLKSHPHTLGQASGHRQGERRARGRSKPRRHYADQSAETINCAMPYPPTMTAAKLPATTARRNGGNGIFHGKPSKQRAPLPRQMASGKMRPHQVHGGSRWWDGSGRRPSSPTAGDPCSGACATRAYAAPRAAAGACGQASTPTRVRASGRDADTNGAALGHPAASSAGHDTIVDFDTEGGTRIAGTATRSDLHGPTAVETRSRLRRIPRGCCRNRHGGDDRST